jgi:hypothetical protein
MNVIGREFLTGHISCPTGEYMIQNASWKLTIVTLSAASALSLAYAGPETPGSTEQRIAGDRTVLGIVEEIRSDQARIGTSEGQPRFVPMNVRKEKNLAAFKKGDLIEMTINDQNLLVDVHLPGHGQLGVPARSLRPIDGG